MNAKKNTRLKRQGIQILAINTLEKYKVNSDTNNQTNLVYRTQNYIFFEKREENAIKRPFIFLME